MASDYPLFSIVIPTYNEAEDIAITLDNLLLMDYPRIEIIVVDDSTDETPEIVARYAERGIRMIHRERNDNGPIGARNVGLKAANGEVVMVLNADALPDPDYFRKISPYYQDGADFVVVHSSVANRDNPWGRYIYAYEQQAQSQPGFDPLWSEGFTVRKSAAAAVGYFPGDYPVNFCRDVFISINLQKAGFKKVVDETIEVPHIAPDRLETFWKNRVWRGTFSAPTGYYMLGRPIWWIILREWLKIIRQVLYIILIIPVFRDVLRSSRYVGGLKDVPSLFGVTIVDRVAQMLGWLKGLSALIRQEGLFAERYQDRPATTQHSRS